PPSDSEVDSYNNDIRNPTSSEYAGQAAKEFLNILDAVAQAVPIPGFGAAVKIAANIMKTCEESHATLERAQELKLRIKTLVLTLVNELKGKKAEEIQAKLIQDIGMLKKDMQYIETMLNEIASQHRLLIIFFKTLNEDKLARDIEHTEMLARLEQQIAAFHAQQQRSLDNIQVTMDKVEALLNERLPPGDASSSPSAMRAVIPEKSAIFHGRDSIVGELVNVVTGASRRHVCILGPGGVGKTSTALAVMGHENVKTHFANHLRIWVPCVKATSVSLFLETLHSSLGISMKSVNTLGDILAELKTSPPIVILLDNFETPWNADDGQSEVERIIRDIQHLPQVTFFVTMRSSMPPCGDLHWHHVDLRSVDATAAREIYTSWHPEGCEDPDLSLLLESIGNMPLAVMLLAKVAKLTQLTANELIAEYKKQGTLILGQGLDPESSMDVCIGLSVYSSRMKAHPEAFILLCMISMLPVGTSYKMLSKWWARDLPNLVGALEVLKSTSLIEARVTTFFVLPVIQRYILHPSRFSLEVHASMLGSACAFLKEHASMVGDPLYKAHSAALSAEDGNLEAVLLTATAPDPHVIRDGLLTLARHQWMHRPQFGVIEHGLTLMSNIDDDALHGDLLYCYGDIFYRLHQFDKSLKQFKGALAVFLSVPDRKKAAECRLSINTVLKFHPEGNIDTRRKIIIEAQADYESAHDKAGAGDCLHALGNLKVRHDSTSIGLLKQAQLVFAEVKDLRRHAACTLSLVRAHYKSSDYDSSYACGVSALEQYEDIGYVSQCAIAAADLGRTLSALGDHERALRSFLRCVEIRKSMGLLPLGTTLEAMGLAWVRLGKTDDARRAFEESLHQYSSEESTPSTRNGIIRSQLFLKRLEDPSFDPTEKERSALRGRYSVDHVDKILAL
ncbi:hypothetical protein C0991_003001, partial [Blastosporella zonata]